ncbi:MAG: 50S ribosomal protein L3 [Candidatus Krumholzibacteria bacterium]
MELLIGKKLGMTQIFEESGNVIPVSIIQAGPCPIVQVKTPDKDGYSAIQIGFGDVREKRVSKPLKGHFKRGGVTPQRVLREFRVEDASKYKIGDSVGVDSFEGTEKVHVLGVSKGRGFAGVIKRHGFTRGPETHGSHHHRQVGSVGQCAWPARIFKGKKMPGRMGGKNSKVKNLKLVQVDTENNLLYVQGAIPGAVEGFVFVEKA